MRTLWETFHLRSGCDADVKISEGWKREGGGLSCYTRSRRSGNTVAVTPCICEGRELRRGSNSWVASSDIRYTERTGRIGIVGIASIPLRRDTDRRSVRSPFSDRAEDVFFGGFAAAGE